MIDPEFVRSFQRRRLEDALAALVREQGYRATTVSDVVGGAHVARNTFYENFHNLEEAFLSLLDRCFAEILDRLAEGCAGAEDAGRACAALAPILTWIAAQPDLAHTCLIEAPCAGPEGLARKLSAEERVAALLEETLPRDPRSPALALLTVGGLAAVLARTLLTGRAAELPGRLDELAELVGSAAPDRPS